MGRTKKQDSLPGMEPKSIPELDTLLELYAEKTSALSSLRQEVGTVKEQILQEAKKHNVTTYRDESASPPLVLTLTERDVAVKVSVAAGAGLEDDEDAES